MAEDCSHYERMNVNFKLGISVISINCVIFVRLEKFENSDYS